MKTTILFFIFLVGGSSITFAQHDMKKMHGVKHAVKDTLAEKDDDDIAEMDDTMQSMHHDMNMATMSSAFSLNLPMARNGSGTAWNPDATPMYGYILHSHKWMFMFHGDLFIRYNKQDISGVGSRGAEKWDAPDMLMVMGQRKIGKKGLFHFNAMFSTDALIAGGSGYPLLFQTGETWNGKPLVDRQHPHDLFSELSVSYAYAFNPKTDVFLYAGYPGEPALGPVVFMHRPSGMFNPDAPIVHHWEDATHISFGVATLGVRNGKFKLEASSFTGREPDENRYDFDRPLFDSWSGRLSFNPSANWALQVSHGFIKSPEVLHSTEDVNRTTASATYVYPINSNKYVTATALWGQNAIAGEDTSNSALLEATLKMKKLALYMREEWVTKTTGELNLNAMQYGPHTQYAINMLTAGAGYDLFGVGPVTVAAGAQLSWYTSDAKLEGLYGSNPLAGEIYLHIYPKRMK